MTDPRPYEPETQAVHAGIGEYPYRPVIPPIYQVSTFAFENADHGAALFIQHPAGMTHATMGPEARCRARITDGLVRVSVGIENVDDILADLERALEAACSRSTHRARVGAG